MWSIIHRNNNGINWHISEEATMGMRVVWLWEGRADQTW